MNYDSRAITSKSMPLKGELVMREDALRALLKASDDEVGPACSHVAVPPTIDMTDEFREPYVQGYRHALADVRAALRAADPRAESPAPRAGQERDKIEE